MIVVPATVPVVRVPVRMASATKVPVAKAATVTAVVVVVEVAVANAKVRAKAPTQASASVSTLKVAQWHQRLLWVRIRLASQGRIVVHAMHRRVSVRNAVAVAVAELTVQTCRKVKFGVTFAVKHGPKAAASNHKKVANPEVKVVAKAVVVTVGNHVQKVVARVAQSAPSALPALTMAHQVPHLQR